MSRPQSPARNRTALQKTCGKSELGTRRPRFRAPVRLARFQPSKDTARGGRMRIALTHPYCWPYIKRGNERNIEELARYLSAKGHEVITISSKPGTATVEQTDFGRRI